MLHMVECQKTFESLSIRSCVRIEYPEPAVQPWALISRLFISEVRYQRNETVRIVKATDARAFSAKSTKAHIQTTGPSFSDAEANASTNITPAMQSRIDAGIAKCLALALKPG